MSTLALPPNGRLASPITTYPAGIPNMQRFWPTACRGAHNEMWVVKKQTLSQLCYPAPPPLLLIRHPSHQSLHRVTFCHPSQSAFSSLSVNLCPSGSLVILLPFWPETAWALYATEQSNKALSPAKKKKKMADLAALRKHGWIHMLFSWLSHTVPGAICNFKKGLKRKVNTNITFLRRQISVQENRFCWIDFRAVKLSCTVFFSRCKNNASLWLNEPLGWSLQNVSTGCNYWPAFIYLLFSLKEEVVTVSYLHVPECLKCNNCNNTSGL